MTDTKLITLIRAADPETWAQAARTALSTGLPGARRIVLNVVRPVEVRATATPGESWTAVLEGWFETREQAEAARAAFAGDAAVAAHLLADERLIHDSGTRPLDSKIMVTFRRRADLTRVQAQAHWQGRHVEIGLVEHNATDFLLLYFQNHVLPDNPATDPRHDYDGMPVFWMDEGALAQVGAGSPVMKAIADDEKNFADPSGLSTLLVIEEHVFGAPAQGSAASPRLADAGA